MRRETQVLMPLYGDGTVDPVILTSLEQALDLASLEIDVDVHVTRRGG
jgi:hypothetical protein